MRHSWLALVVVSAFAVVVPERGLAHAQPSSPLVKNLEVTVIQDDLPRLTVRYLSFESLVSPDTAQLEIMIEDRLGRQTITTTPERTNLYWPELQLAPGKLYIEIVAVDASGRRSDPNTWHFVQAAVRAPSNCAGPFLYIFLLGPIVIGGLLLGGLVVIALRRWRMPNGPGDVVSLLVADHIGRGVLRRSSSWSVAYAVGIVSAWAFGHSFLAAILSFCAFVPVSSVLAARRVVRELERDRAKAELHGTMLIVRSPNRQAHLATSRRVIEKAQRSAVPTSIAR